MTHKFQINKDISLYIREISSEAAKSLQQMSESITTTINPDKQSATTKKIHKLTNTPIKH